jgi:hypothetical protein
MLMKADGSWMRKSSKLKQISSLQEYFISYPLLEEWSVMNGRILPGERLDHGNYVRRLAQYAQTYSWAAVIAFDDEFRRQLHANNLVLRWRDEAAHRGHHREQWWRQRRCRRLGLWRRRRGGPP